MHWPLVVLLLCYALVFSSVEGEPANSSKEEKNSELKPSSENSVHEDLCEISQNVNEECKACRMLNLAEGGSCCSDPGALLQCHLVIQELGLDADEADADDAGSDEDSAEGDDTSRSSEESGIQKRYGPLFSNWQWYSRDNDEDTAEAKRTMSKRYGNLFGSLFSDRKPNKNKRYGSVFGRLFSQQGDRDKRYGNLFGRLFNRYSEEKRDGSLRKRYGSLFRPLFSSKDKRYGSLFRPLFSKSKRYGSLMGRIYGPRKPNDDKRSSEMDKRYGSLMGRPFSSKKLGKR